MLTANQKVILRQIIAQNPTVEYMTEVASMNDADVISKINDFVSIELPVQRNNIVSLQNQIGTVTAILKSTQDLVSLYENVNS